MDMGGAPSDSAPTAKRGRAHDTPSDLDSALDSLVVKLGATTHDDHDTLVAVLVDVLHVEPEIATFYLEASNWNPSEAVELLMQQTAGGEVVQALADSGVSKRSRPMPVLVNGLPDGWAARVSAAGTIVFEHLATGYEQSTIPPGFQAAASSDERADEGSVSPEVLRGAPLMTLEEQSQYDAWNPSDQQVESEWAQLMSNVPPEGKEKALDFDRSPYEVRKRMVWEGRKVRTAHDEPDPRVGVEESS
jgi:hypothetical protein